MKSLEFKSWFLLTMFIITCLASLNLKAQTFSGTTGALTDNNCNSSFNTFLATVSSVGQMDVIENVTVNITHTWSGDLLFFLVAPNGQILELSTGNGSSGDNYTNTVFTDNASTFITSGSAPFTGSFKPEGRYNNDDQCYPTGSLGTYSFATQFWSDDPNGTWSLKIKDGSGGDVGTLNSWSVTIGPRPIAQNVGINTVNPIATLDVNGKIKVGNDALPGAAGMIRFSSSSNDFEGFNGTTWKSMTSTGLLNRRINDADNNTSVDVETNPNENIIRFTLDGTERFTMFPTRLNINTGTNTFIGLNAGLNNIGINSTGVGENALLHNQGLFNSAFGSGSLSSNTSGEENSAFGLNSLRYNTTGSWNSAFGTNSLHFNEAGEGNSAFGRSSLEGNVLGSNNSAFGFSSLQNNTSGEFNSSFGSYALLSNTTGSSNSSFGAYSLSTNTTGVGNAAYGFEALKSNTTAHSNSSFGAYSLSNNTTGEENSAFGTSSLGYNTTGKYNSAFGRSALLNNQNGGSNSAFGWDALHGNLGGFLNSAFGTQALFNNTSGEDNSAFGASALLYNTTGSNNIAIGKNAGRFDVGSSINQISSNSIYLGVDTRASQNGNTNEIVIGNEAIGAGSNTITIGNNQTVLTNIKGAVGYFPIGTNAGETGQVKFHELAPNGTNAVTLKSPDNIANNINLTLPATSGTTGQVLSTDGTGILNWVTSGGGSGNGLVHPTTGSTFESGTNNPSISGTENTAIGVGAGDNILSAIRCTAFGYNALTNVTVYSRNSAFGYNSLANHFEGTNNSAFGVEALFNQSGGNDNSAFGSNALYNNNLGEYNSAFGVNSLLSNVSGIKNTAVGFGALANNTTGGFNTAVGYNAFTTGLNYFRSTALGYQSTITADDQIRLGTTTIGSIGGYEPWTDLSDSRFKKNIEENVVGIEFIKKLKPVTYNLNVAKLNDFLNIPDSVRDVEGEVRKAQEIRHGFLAQDVEEAANSLGFDFNGVDKPKNEHDHYGLRYSVFVVPLVKAVQEQQLMIESLIRENEILKENKTVFQNENKELRSDFNQLASELKVLKEIVLKNGGVASLKDK